MSRPAEPGLAPVARRVGHEPLRQVRLGEDLVAPDRGERHLGRGDAPEVVALDGVGVVGELRQLAGGGEGRGGDERRRADLLEGVGVAVEGELAQRPAHRGAEAPQHREHRARDLHRPLVVEDAEGGADLPVRHPLVRAVALGVVADGGDHDVVVLGLAVGRVGGRDVGDAQQDVAQVAARRRRPAGRRRPPRRPGAGSRPWPPRPPAASPPAAQPAHLLRQLVDLPAQVVALRRQVPLLAVELEGGVELLRAARVAPAGPWPPARRPGRSGGGGRRSWPPRVLAAARGGRPVNRPRRSRSALDRACGAGAGPASGRVAGSLRYTMTAPMAATTAATSVAVFMPLV